MDIINILWFVGGLWIGSNIPRAWQRLQLGVNQLSDYFRAKQNEEKKEQPN